MADGNIVQAVLVHRSQCPLRGVDVVAFENGLNRNESDFFVAHLVSYRGHGWEPMAVAARAPCLEAVKVDDRCINIANSERGCALR